VAAVCTTLAEHGELAPRKLGSAARLSTPTLLRVVAALESEGIVGRRRGRLRLLHPGCDPETVSLEAEERRRAYEASRVAMMRGYAETASCRREYLMNYFGEPYAPSDCRRCDNSLNGRPTPGSSNAGPFTVGAPVRHEAWGDGLVERTTADTVTVLFDAVGFKTFDLGLVHERGLLEPVEAAP
jgi:ATP-dependent DNA helicase RecQ